MCLATLLTLCLVHLQAPFRHGILTPKIKGYNAEMRSYDDIEVSVKVTGSKTLENGLVVPGTFKTRTPNRAIATKELCAHMDISVKTLRKIPTLS